MTHALVAAARAYLGAPYAHQGRARAGMDCAGLIWLAWRDCGEHPPDVKGYGPRPWRDGLTQAVELFYGDPIPGPIEPGDCLLIRFREQPQHLAIATDYIGGGLGIIHTRSDISDGKQRGKVVEHRLDPKWQKRIIRIYRR